MPSSPGDYRIYADLAGWWPLISPPGEYTIEAAYLAAVLAQAGCRDVLDLGSGGGHVALHLKDRFSLTLVDISEPMLTVSAQLNPECEHRQGDMRTVRLGRRFDAVLVHDSIDYITGVSDLRRVIETAAAHCRPGGIALFVPDHVKDTFCEFIGGGGGGVDEDGRTASFSERTWDPDPADDWVQADYEFTLHQADGQTSVISESHRLSAFSQATWISLLSLAGFELEPELEAALEAALAATADRGGPEREAASRRPGNLLVARLSTRPARLSQPEG